MIINYWVLLDAVDKLDWLWTTGKKNMHPMDVPCIKNKKKLTTACDEQGYSGGALLHSMSHLCYSNVMKHAKDVV